jgi:DNA-binding winged helix-turn-helix (wHTH) protein
MDGLAVEESNSPVQIAALRRVLSEAPGGDRWIETLPRRGYRFVGPVEVQDEFVDPVDERRHAVQRAAGRGEPRDTGISSVPAIQRRRQIRHSVAERQWPGGDLADQRSTAISTT